MRLRHSVPLLVALLASSLYLVTSGPTFGFIDEGELAAVASTGGVAHPTGYPTLTMLGWLVTRLPFRDITELNVLAALLSGFGAGMLALAFRRLLVYVKREEESDDALRSGIVAMVIAGCGIWWRQGTGFEVYALHAVFLPTLLWLFIGWVQVIEDSHGGGTGRRRTMHRAPTAVPFRYGFLFAVVLGLSFTNHMSTIFLAPAFLFFYAVRIGVTVASLKRLLPLVPGFLLGLLPYLYIPLRAAADPRFNWSNAETWWGFTRHLTGAQYGVWMFTEPQSFALQSGYVLPLIVEELLYVGPLLALLGLWSLLSKKRTGAALAAIGLLLGALLLLMNYSGDSISGVVIPIILIAGAIVGVSFFRAERDPVAGCPADRPVITALFLLLIILSTFLWSGGYSILDIESYYLASLVGIGGLILFGLDYLRRWVAPQVVLIGGTLLAVAVVATNYESSDRSDLWLIEDAATNMLESLPPDAIVISGLWDFWLSGSWYLQEVEGMRPDVAVIDHNLLKYSWYVDQLESAHPELMGRVSAEVAAFRQEQYRFERDLPYDAAVIDRLYVTMIDRMIATALEENRPVLLTFDMNEGGAGGMRYGAAWTPPNRRVPWGLGYMVHPGGDYLPQEFPTWRFRERKGEPNGYEASLYQWYATAAKDRAQYEMIHGNDSLARAYLEYGLRFDPGWETDDFHGTAHGMAQGMALRVEEMTAQFAWMRQALGSLR